MPMIRIEKDEMPMFAPAVVQKMKDAGFEFTDHPGERRQLIVALDLGLTSEWSVTANPDGSYTFTQGDHR